MNRLPSQLSNSKANEAHGGRSSVLQIVFHLSRYDEPITRGNGLYFFAFELKRRLRNHLFQTAAALLASGRRLVRKFLINLDLITAFFATEFVNWHR